MDSQIETNGVLPVAMTGKTMEVVTWGTRGSGSVTLMNQPNVYGSNTTAVEIRSRCLPDDTVLIIDGGFGAAACNFQYNRENVTPKHIFWLFTHYHLDHITGALNANWWYDKRINKHLFGPQTRKGRGPSDVFSRLMDEDFWPVTWRAVSSAFKTHTLESPSTEILLVHPRGGIGKMTLDAYENALKKGLQLSIGGNKYHHDEMLVIKMWRTSHKEETISYRFEERPTGRVFTFLTDHECTATIPLDMLAHIKGSHLLIIDAQYTSEKYAKTTGGWGHATPRYAMQVARATGVQRVLLTHHDPQSRNQYLESVILAEARQAMEPSDNIDVGLAKDYDVLGV